MIDFFCVALKLFLKGLGLLLTAPKSRPKEHNIEREKNQGKRELRRECFWFGGPLLPKLGQWKANIIPPLQEKHSEGINY